MTSRRADNSKALNAFLAAKREIDGMIARLKTLSDDPFDTHPDAIHLGDVGTLNYYASLLRQPAATDHRQHLQRVQHAA